MKALSTFGGDEEAGLYDQKQPDGRVELEDHRQGPIVREWEGLTISCNLLLHGQVGTPEGRFS